MDQFSDLPCSIEEFSNTVEVIYDSVIKPDRWREAIGMIAGICDSQMSSVNVYDLKTNQNLSLYDHGYPSDFWARYEPYAAEHPIVPAGSLMSVGDVTTLANLCDDEEFFESRIYREVLQPLGYFDFIGMVGLRSASRVGFLHACRLDTQPRYSQAQIRIFQLLAKHVCRAMKISDLFDLQTLKSEMLEASLDRLAAGVFLVSRDGRVVHMNGTAERQVRNADALRLVANRLFPSDPAAGSLLDSSLAAVMNDEAEALQNGYAVALPGRNGEGLVATILPLERGDRRAISKPFAAAAAVFVQDPAVLPQFPEKRSPGCTA
jgi:PAS domain-containing protein